MISQLVNNTESAMIAEEGAVVIDNNNNNITSRMKNRRLVDKAELAVAKAAGIERREADQNKKIKKKMKRTIKTLMRPIFR